MSQYQEELRSALFEVQRYLLDEIPPLNATDAIHTLTGYPPEPLISQVNAWALEQGRIQGVSLSDCLFHALKKIHMISTLKLIDQSLLEGYLNRVVPLALDLCPAEDREALRANLLALRQSLHFSSVSAVDIGRGSSSAEKAKPGILSQVASTTARRFSLAIDRLLRKAKSAPNATASDAAPAASGRPPDMPMAQLVSMAAESSTSEDELNEYVETLKPIAGQQEGDIISILASSVPGWEIVQPPESVAKPPKSIEAMHKVMSLTKDPTKSTSRFRGLVMAAVSQFNDGSLGAAASILDLAEVIVKEKKLDPSTVERIQNDALKALGSDQLKKYTENKSKHRILRKVLGYFPTLRMEALFDELRGEQKPERRRAILALLEAYGSEGRDAALGELEKELARAPEEIDTYYLRNVIYLLHRIPRESESETAREFELLTRASAIGQSIYVIKEAVIPLGQMKSEGAVKLLTTRLAEFEAMLVRGKNIIYPVEEVQRLLDRIITTLGRIGTPVALLTIARHGMKANPILGDTRARLAVLSQFDLSFDEQTVNVIIKAIREDLPSTGKLINRIIGKRQTLPGPLIEALASTRSEVVDNLLAEIAQNFPGDESGRIAANAIQNRSASGQQVASPRETATLTGDLQFFALPSLLQSLADQQATGIATFISKDRGQTAGKLLVVKGLFADAQMGVLRGVNALYQLLERPIVGTFAFVPNEPEKVKTKTEPMQVMPLLMEGIRRFDELKQMLVVVPEDAALKAGGVKPTPASEEEDAALVREIWVKASGGTPLSEWENEIAADSYRVRRIVAHWVEEGALQLAT